VKLPRVSIGTLMIFVGVAAVDLALGRAIHAYHRGLLPGIALSGLVLQVGLFRMIRGKGMVRAFWAGYIAAGALTFSSLLFPGSRFWTAWYTYFLIVGNCLRILPEVGHAGLPGHVRPDRPLATGAHCSCRRIGGLVRRTGCAGRRLAAVSVDLTRWF
jgi:hypothetical protein